MRQTFCPGAYSIIPPAGLPHLLALAMVVPKCIPSVWREPCREAVPGGRLRRHKISANMIIPISRRSFCAEMPTTDVTIAASLAASLTGG